MRWTKGKPAADAPCGVPLLTVVDRQGGKPIYAILKRERGAWRSYGDGTTQPTWSWSHHPSGQYADEPDRYWRLPGREAG